MKTLLVAINSKYIHSNLAIRCLKAYADSKGEFNINIAEYTINQPISLILCEIIKEQPDAIGLSCYIWNYDYIAKLVVEIKKILPDCFVFLGGPEVSFNPHDVLLQTNCNAVICGEGEDAFFQLLQDLNSNAPVKNVIHGKLIPLDDVPFVYTDYTLLQNRIVYYEASRGCPFRCGYCLSGGSIVRFLSTERVFSDLQKFLQAGIRQVKFIDRTFNCNKQFAMNIWHFLKENDNGITNFHFEIAAELLDDEMIAFLQAVRQGQFQLEIGVQSTNPPTLSAINRHTDCELLTKTIKSLQKNQNIHLHLDLIAGLPYEEYNHFKTSFNFVYSLMPDQLQLGFLKLLKGSALYATQLQFGLVATSYPPYEVIKTNWLSFNDIQRLKMIEEMVEIYYNSNRFKKSIAIISKGFDTPFDFFEQLSLFYSQNELHLRPHSKVEYYEILWSFAKTQICENMDSTALFWGIRHDMYSHEKAKKLPDFAQIKPDNTYKNRIYSFFDNRENIVKYLPEYQEFDTKQLIRNAHIEIFPPNAFGNNSEEAAILYNYRRCDLLGNAHTASVKL